MITAPKIDEKKLEFNKELVLSTGHITGNDDKLLNTFTSSELCVYDYEYGYRIAVFEYNDELFQKSLQVIMEEGYSESFCTLLLLAKEQKCQWLRLDCDGMVYDQLETFEW